MIIYSSDCEGSNEMRVPDCGREIDVGPHQSA